jgi:hypothetical protein
MNAGYSTTEYRYPYETLILLITIGVVLLVIALTAAATICTSAVFVPLVVTWGYFISRHRHQQLLAQANQVSAHSAPGLAALIEKNRQRLPGAFQPAERLYLRARFAQSHRAVQRPIQGHGPG